MSSRRRRVLERTKRSTKRSELFSVHLKVPRPAASGPSGQTLAHQLGRPPALSFTSSGPPGHRNRTGTGSQHRSIQPLTQRARRQGCRIRSPPHPYPLLTKTPCHRKPSPACGQSALSPLRGRRCVSPLRNIVACRNPGMSSQSRPPFRVFDLSAFRDPVCQLPTSFATRVAAISSP